MLVENFRSNLQIQALNSNGLFHRSWTLGEAAACEYFNFAEMETQYFLCLVQIQRAGTKKLKDYFQKNREEIRSRALQLHRRLEKDFVLSESDRSIFYSTWVYSAVHLMTTMDQKMTLPQIQNFLGLSRARTQSAIKFLLKTKIIYQDGDKYYSGSIFTHLEKSSPEIIKHHTNWRLRAIEKAEVLTDSELMYSVTCSLSKKDFALFREELVQLFQKFLKRIKDSPGEDLAHLNVDWLNLRSDQISL